MGDHVDESLTGSLANLAPCRDQSISSKQNLSSSEIGLSSSNAESGTMLGSRNGPSEDNSAEYALSNLSNNNELHSELVNTNDAVMEAHGASSSIKEQPLIASVTADTTAASHVDLNPGNLHSDGESIGDANTDVHTAESGSAVTSQPLPGSPLSDREQDPRSASVLFVDVVSIHSNILSSSIAEISSREARRNRRMFWDAFSRSSFRRNRDSPTIVFTTGHTDDLGSHDRWLLDLSGDLHDDGVGRESRYSGARSHHRNERQWQSRYEVIVCTFPSHLRLIFKLLLKRFPHPELV